MKVIGQVLCNYCDSPRILLGEVDGEPLTISTALRDVVERGAGFYKLSCGHLWMGLGGLLSSQEWIALNDGTILRNGHIPLVELGKGRL